MSLEQLVQGAVLVRRRENADCLHWSSASLCHDGRVQEPAPRCEEKGVHRGDTSRLFQGDLCRRVPRQYSSEAINYPRGGNEFKCYHNMGWMCVYICIHADLESQSTTHLCSSSSMTTYTYIHIAITRFTHTGDDGVGHRHWPRPESRG